MTAGTAIFRHNPTWPCQFAFVENEGHDYLGQNREGLKVDDPITPEEYFREHAELLRIYARYTEPKASERLLESARFLEWQADRARDRRIAEAMRGRSRRQVGSKA